LYCEWSDWTGFSGCTATCGVGIQFRKRLLAVTDQKPDNPVSSASTEKECEGELIDIHECPSLPQCDPCTPQDCSLGDWSDWSDPLCEGICTRSRTVATPSNDCGEPCHGSLNGTKPCEADCHSKDCKLGDWSGWTTCSSELAQKYHSRSVLEVGAYHGKACSSEALNESYSCLQGPDAPINCEFSAWAAWGMCSTTCGTGQQSRERTIAVKASKGGQACIGGMSSVQACTNAPCADDTESGLQDCQTGPWSIWHPCEQGQQVRTRQVIHPATSSGEACIADLRETQGCGEAAQTSQNCVFSVWGEWTECPASCGGAQSSRSRVIESHAKGDGLQCSGTMLETQPCGEDPCPGSPNTVCKYSDWSGWGACSRTCGEGFKERARNISEPALGGPDGCHGAVIEATACSGTCNVGVDCQWAQWSEWSDCVPAPTVCGIGYKSRNRSIAVMPALGGALCDPRHMEEMLPVTNCNGQPKCCIDGQWDDWLDWGGCSATCGAGTRKRARDIKVKETYCGKPAVGSAVDYDKCSAEPCVTDVDCEFGEWSDPTVCSAVCHGHQTVTREITKNSTGNGKPCEGTLTKAERCNPAEGQEEPFSCANKEHAATGVQDCVMDQWSDWSPCSATCEKGYSVRARQIQVNPQRGGKSCPPEIKEITSCNSGITCFPERENCVWEAWTNWSACDAFDKKTRSRGIAQHAANGGLDCEGEFRQIEGCDEGAGHCPTSWYNCSWGAWSTWTECSKTCGSGGARTRSRQLKVGNESVDAPHGGGSGVQFDCTQGFANWRIGWSKEMKTWCCKNNHVGCEAEQEPFNCNEGYNNWRAGWSNEMKQYCCHHHQKGCEADDASGTYSQQVWPANSGYASSQSASGSFVQKYEDVPFLEAKVRQAEAKRTKELQLSFALGSACLVILGLVARSGRLALVPRSADGATLPTYNAVPQHP